VALHRAFGDVGKTGGAMAWTSEPLDADDLQLLGLVACGLSDVEIGMRLQLGERTVRDRVRSLRQVLQVKNREELAAWAGAHGYYRPGRVGLAAGPA
jgi:DNA-binding NarL/FixJ family response regulator